MTAPTRTRRIDVRVTEDEHALVNTAARAVGVSLSEFCRAAARQQASEVLTERSDERSPENGAFAREFTSEHRATFDRLAQ